MARAAAVVTALAVGAFWVSGASAAPRAIDVELVGETSVTGIPGAVAVDASAGRAYVVDATGRSVRVVDLSGGGLRLIASIGGVGAVSAIAVDEGRSRVLVVDEGVTNTVRVIDVSPGSPTTGTVVGTIPTAGRGEPRIAIDPLSGRAYLSNGDTDDVIVVDPESGVVRTIPVPAGPVDVAVDADRQVVYVASAVDPSLTTIFASGASTVPLADRPSRMALTSDRLFVLSAAGLAGVSSFRLDGMQVLRRSAAMPAAADIGVDVIRHRLYVTSGTSGSNGLWVLGTGTLDLETSTPHRIVLGLAVEPTTGDIVSSESGGGTSVIARSALHSDPLPAVDRLGGADRFEVSARVSADTGRQGVPVAYIASGAGFADALSGSVAAGVAGGPILLVTRDTIPATVAAELTRLRPKSIVILGGTASIDSSVEAQLARYSRTPITRLGGADRYAVSAAVSASAFPAGGSTAFVASGEVFPDALAGSALAGFEGAPVLLTQKGAVPATVAAELDRLGATRVVVLGGPASVSEAVVAALADGGARHRDVERIGGADRFAVAAGVAALFPAHAESVYLASGAVFPDALSGSAAAIASGSPVLLVGADTVPGAVSAQLERLRPYRIAVLGGPSTVSDGLLPGLQRYLAF